MQEVGFDCVTGEPGIDAAVCKLQIFRFGIAPHCSKLAANSGTSFLFSRFAGGNSFESEPVMVEHLGEVGAPEPIREAPVAIVVRSILDVFAKASDRDEGVPANTGSARGEGHSRGQGGRDLGGG